MVYIYIAIQRWPNFNFFCISVFRMWLCLSVSCFEVLPFSISISSKVLSLFIFPSQPLKLNLEKMKSSFVVTFSCVLNFGTFTVDILNFWWGLLALNVFGNTLEPFSANFPLWSSLSIFIYSIQTSLKFSVCLHFIPLWAVCSVN